MPVQEELEALRRAREAWRRIVGGERQGIRRPQQPSPQITREEEGSGGQAEETAS
jgi:hypothetical protein